MTTTVSNVLNPKALEKQIKIYDARLAVLQAEVDELTRLRAACELLLGAPAAEAAPAESAPVKAKSKKETKEAEAAADETLLPADPEATHEAPELDQ